MQWASAKLYRITLGDNIFSLQRKALDSPRRSAPFIPLFSNAGKFHASTIADIATQISEGNYAFLGLKLNHETKINWHKDYYSGFVWPLLPHTQVRSATPKNVDLKHAWELSSFFHLFPVAVAYSQTLDEKYQLFVIDQIRGWLAANPCPLGVNWANPMVVALRLILLIEVVNLICPDNTNAAFRQETDTALWEHFLYLINNLENLGPCPGNHYLTNIVGILWASLYFSPKHMMIRHYRKWAVDNLSKEIQRQTHSDGMNFEGSTCYHRLVTELLLYAVILMKKNGIEISGLLHNRLQNMLEILYLLADSRRDIPIIGDNDNCRLFYGSDYFEWNSQNINYLLPIGAQLYGRHFSTYNPNDELCQWIWKEYHSTDQKHAPVSELLPRNRAIALYSSQFYISKHDSDYLLINCNHPGHIRCGHSHNDTLSFILHFEGTEIFVDPGSYVYTRDLAMRNYFRSTRCHNILQVNDEEQWPIPDNAPFYLPKLDSPRVLTWKSGNQEDIFEGEHYGYLRLSEKVIHRRYYRYRKIPGELTIRDLVFSSPDIEGTASRFKISTFFHVSRDVMIEKLTENTFAFSRINDCAPLCHLVWPDKDNPKVEIKDAWISKAYGVKHKAQMIFFEIETFLPYSFEFTISKTIRRQ
jgi:hypothetical protein